MKNKHPKMDRLLVSKQEWEIEYIAKKFGCSNKDVLDAIKYEGHSRRKLYAYLRSWF